MYLTYVPVRIETIAGANYITENENNIKIKEEIISVICIADIEEENKMEIITLLGMILENVANSTNLPSYAKDFSWDYIENLSIRVDLESTPEIGDCAESLLEVGDCVKTKSYDLISIVFENKRVSKVYFENEEHDVKDCIDRYVRCRDIEDVYILMCYKIIAFLKDE